MIVDKLKNAHFYYGINANYQKAMEFLQYTDLKNLENGKYQIKNDEIYAIVQEYETKSESKGKLEAHKKYTDIQYIVEGQEKLGYTNIENFSPSTEYDSEKDIIFGDGDCDFITANPREFLIFTPEDAHMPCISTKSPSHVKKIVIKIRNVVLLP